MEDHTDHCWLLELVLEEPGDCHNCQQQEQQLHDQCDDDDDHPDHHEPRQTPGSAHSPRQSDLQSLLLDLSCLEQHQY